MKKKELKNLDLNKDGSKIRRSELGMCFIQEIELSMQRFLRERITCHQLTIDRLENWKNLMMAKK